MSGNIYISGKSSNNKITISGSGEKKDIDLSTKEANNNLATQNNNAKYYSDKALESANKAEQQANLAKGYAESIVETKNELLNNEDFKTVVNNIDNINTVGENIENVITIAEDLERVADNLDIINNVNDNLDAITNVNTNIQDINTVASNIEDIQNAEENANIAKEKAQESADYSELSKQWAISDELVDNTDYSSKYYAEASKTQADIATSKTSEVIESGNIAISEITNTKNIAISDIETLADNTKTEIETLGNEKVELATVQAEIAITKASEANQSASNALKSAENSALSEANAKESENNAKTSETNAKTSEQNAKSSEQRCEEIYSRLGIVIIVKGRVDSLEDLPTTNVVNGDAYLVGVEGLSSYPEYYWYEDHWEYMGSTEVKLEWGGITGTLSNQSDLQAVLDSKADDNEVVHLAGDETITGAKKFNTIPTVPTASVGTKNLRVANTEFVQKALTDYAKLTDIPDTSNFATKDEIPTDYATKDELNSKQDTLTAGENITIENGVISSTGDSVDLTGYIKNQEAMTGSIVIGNTSTASNAIVIGTNQRATGRYSIAMGDDCTLSSTSGISIGRSNTLSGTSNTAIGIGVTTSGGNSIGIGRGSCKATGTNALAIGTGAQATGSSQSLAIGYGALATQNNTIQFGLGTNNTADTFQVWDYPLLNKADGKIYADRLPEVGGREVGEFVTGFWSAGFVPENLLYCDGTELSGATGQMFSNLYNDYLVGKVKLISGIFDVYYGSSSNYETLLALKLGNDVTTQKTILIDQSLAANSYIAYLKDGYLLVGDRANSSGFQQTAVEPNSIVYIKLKFENGSLVVSSGTSKSNLSEPFVFDSVSVIGSYFTITSKSICDVLSSSVINGKALYANDAFCSDVVVYGTPTITDGGDSIEGARLETCTYDEYQTELTMTGSCYKWAVDIENQKFRIPFIPDKVLVDVADTVGVKGNGNGLGVNSGTGYDFYLTQHAISNNSTRYFTTNYYSATVPQVGKTLELAAGKDKGISEGVLGLSEDASKSGIIADTTSAKTYKTIRHYVVVATGSINQSEADWSEFASSLASKANKTDVDGQWIAKQAVLTQAVTAGETAMDLSDYLPNDNYQYEVLLLVSVADTADNSLNIYSDIIPKSSFSLGLMANARHIGFYMSLPIGIGRVLYQELNQAGVAGNTRGIEALAYRRIGTNQ